MDKIKTILKVLKEVFIVVALLLTPFFGPVLAFGPSLTALLLGFAVLAFVVGMVMRDVKRDMKEERERQHKQVTMNRELEGVDEFVRGLTAFVNAVAEASKVSATSKSGTGD